MHPQSSPWIFATLAILLLFASCNPPRSSTNTDRELFSKIFADSNLETQEEVEAAVAEAISHKNVILFVNLDWAIMAPMREAFVDLMLACEQLELSPQIAFRYIDCTSITSGYAPLRSLPGWKSLESENGGQALISGYGEFVWIKDGRVRHVESPQNFATIHDLVQKTKSLGLIENVK